MLMKIVLLVVFGVCSSSNIESRIYYGQEAKKGQFPWQAGLVILAPTKPTIFQGGAVISELWILTSAHFITVDISKIIVLLGSVIHPFKKDDQRFETMASRWVVHDKYQFGSNKFDVGLVKLEKALVFNEFIKPVRLASKDVSSRTSVIISGFGEYPSQFSDLRFSVQMTFNCSKRFPNMICAYADPESIAQNACPGDEGGALVTNFVDPIHVGVATYTNPCGWFGYNLYTSTVFNRDWIRQVSGV